ncbi:MAG: sugar phosphate nucleotidyltransferase [bacterium]
MYIVIRAGGSGKRLWPASRNKMPKQLLQLVGKQTLLEQAVDRALKIEDPKNIYISTNVEFVADVKKLAKNIPAKNIFAEPEKRDTAAAIGLEAAIIFKRDPKAVIVSLASDHVVNYTDEFARVVKTSVKMIKKHPDKLLQIGIHPSYPDTGYGYIETGKIIDEVDHFELYQIKKFTEKPNLKKAKEFLSKGNFLWNANMFVWKASTILNTFEILLPDMHKQLMKIAEAVDTNNFDKVLKAEYKNIDKIAIDYAILEKSDKTVAVAANIGWSDVGDWLTIKDIQSDKEKDNVLPKDAIAIDTENVLVYGKNKKLYAVLGLENVVIIDTEDALLVCDKYRAQEVKKIVNKLEEDKKDKYL